MRTLKLPDGPGGLLRRLRAWIKACSIGAGYRPERHYMRGRRLPGAGAG
ncbi:hypothetical protein [Siccirubricoccus sp. G192]|nr:hypothetical protein [Siccirubricoccus sp. G192]MBV1796329.1 hypothetical protein [Siccirubricoccus sp. G192]